ncbi:hypothetical protein NDU88_002873 [Pleurodeles waltl]|uniref:Uncharacterized protein n=1 Tax=Pleurodeles waltl TaxID=8319 RepID=A0AAV7PAZ5_PLEWA|nr:hypothetical protein NDU88_002873 [Pleurodeles waltl]
MMRASGYVLTCGYLGTTKQMLVEHGAIDYSSCNRRGGVTATGSVGPWHSNVLREYTFQQHPTPGTKNVGMGGYTSQYKNAQVHKYRRRMFIPRNGTHDSVTHNHPSRESVAN